MSRPRPRWRLIGVIGAWVIVPLVLMEVAVRLNPFGLLRSGRDPYGHLRNHDLHPIEFDSALGWVPAIGRFDHVWRGRALTVGPDRLRSNGTKATPVSGPSILATGDSFTFGDWVADDETWPAYLEEMLGVPVLNGGVSSYGFDQTVMRTEQLVARLSPSLVIVSLIDDDITRTMVSSRANAAKPWFRLEGDGIALDPTPLRDWETISRLALLERQLRRSAILRLLFREYLYPERRRHEDGVAVCCALVDRLAELQRARSVPVTLLAQYGPGLERQQLAAVQACARSAGLDVVDALPRLQTLKRRSPEQFDALFRYHMLPAGNRVIAETVRDHLAAPRFDFIRTGREQTSAVRPSGEAANAADGVQALESAP